MSDWTYFLFVGPVCDVSCVVHGGESNVWKSLVKPPHGSRPTGGAPPVPLEAEDDASDDDAVVVAVVVLADAVEDEAEVEDRLELELDDPDDEAEVDDDPPSPAA